jgi:hypothetical protein
MWQHGVVADLSGPVEDIATAVLPVVRAAVAAGVRRALTVAADLLAAQEMDDAAAVVRYLSTPHTDDTATTSADGEHTTKES